MGPAQSGLTSQCFPPCSFCPVTLLFLLSHERARHTLMFGLLLLFAFPEYSPQGYAYIQPLISFKFQFRYHFLNEGFLTSLFKLRVSPYLKPCLPSCFTFLHSNYHHLTYICLPFLLIFCFPHSNVIHKGRDCCFICSLLYPLGLSLALGRHPVNVCSNE